MISFRFSASFNLVCVRMMEKKSSNGSGLLILYDKPFGKGKVLSDATALSTPELDEFAEIAATDKNTLAIFKLLCKPSGG